MADSTPTQAIAPSEAAAASSAPTPTRVALPRTQAALANRPKAVEKAQAPPPFMISTPANRKYIKILIYGEPGTGKTYLAGSAADVPQMRDVLYIDVESGSETLIERWPMLPLININSFKQVARIYEFLVRHCQARDTGDIAKLRELEERVTAQVPEEPRQFHTVVIDSLSEVQKLNMYQLLSIDIGARLDEEFQAPEFAEWNKTTEMVRLLVRSFRDLPMHVIFISGDREEEGKKQTINFPRELGRSLPGFLDAVGFYQAEVKPKEGGGREVERRLYLEAGRRFLAKHWFGSNAVPEGYLVNPTMQDIFNLRQQQRG